MAKQTSKKQSESVKPVYVVAGEGGRLHDAQLAKVRRQVLQGCDWSMCLREFDGEEAVITEVLDELRTLPFLGPRRAVEVHGADGFITKYREMLEKYLASPCATGVLILLPEKPLRGNLRLTKLINKIGQTFSLGTPKSHEIPHLLARLAKDTHGKTLNPGVGQALHELVGDSLNTLAEELEKLSLYVGKRQTISIEDVQALVGNNRELSAFEMIDALVKRNTAQAMELLERILSQDRSAEYTVIGLLAWYVRRMRKAQTLLAQGQGEGQICTQLKIWYRQREFIQQVKQLSPESLRLACKQLTQADRAVKTGAASVRSAVEKFILCLTGDVAAVG